MYFVYVYSKLLSRTARVQYRQSILAVHVRYALGYTVWLATVISSSMYLAWLA